LFWIVLIPYRGIGLPGTPDRIVVAPEASASERFAAREVRRYVYLRTGTLLPICQTNNGSGAIVVARSDSMLARDLAGVCGEETTLSGLATDACWIRAVPGNGAVLVSGVGDYGVLQGAYRYAELLGIRFQLEGDVVPDEQVPLSNVTWNVRFQPRFALRGVLPFHDFPEGPDWWTRDQYLAFVVQLPKLGLNFLGLHCYFEGARYIAEPTVWMGLPQDVAGDGRVRFGYPATYQNTFSGQWGHVKRKTSGYSHGTGMLFEEDLFGPEVMHGLMPVPDGDPERCQLFDHTAGLLRDVFGAAHARHIKTCLGTTIPMVLPKALEAHVKQQGLDPSSMEARTALFEGAFLRIQKSHSLDYYWLWTDEGWMTMEVSPEVARLATNDWAAALAALSKLTAASDGRPPFALAAAGWVPGPGFDPMLFDKVLPSTIPIAALNQNMGASPVDPVFARIEQRPKWVISWLEDDAALSVSQLWAGRVLRDAEDAGRHGCDGFIGIHWRTRALGPQAAALARAGWIRREAGVDDTHAAGSLADLYEDWAASQFGSNINHTVARLFLKLDGRLPRPADWVGGPGGIRPDSRPWEVVSNEFKFVDDFERFRSRVTGAGAVERYDYWLRGFRQMRAIARLNCAWSRYEEGVKSAGTLGSPALRLAAARDKVLPWRLEMVRAVDDVYANLRLSDSADLGALMNWERLLDRLDRRNGLLTNYLGSPLPEEALFRTNYVGEPRLMVPTARSSIGVGEALRVRAMVLAEAPAREVRVFWRPLGGGVFDSGRLDCQARGVYQGIIPAGTGDFEYYIEMTPASGECRRFPVTAPRINQTVVVEEPLDKAGAVDAAGAALSPRDFQMK
jgi:hypothetical protein